MTNKKVLQANKLVSKATTVFGDAVVQVEKANELLKKGIEEDSFEIASAEEQIAKLQRHVKDVEKEREEKAQQIVSNNKLIDQLKSFVPPTE